MNQYFKNLEIIQKYGEPPTPEHNTVEYDEERPYQLCVRCAVRLVEEEELEGVCSLCKEEI